MFDVSLSWIASFAVGLTFLVSGASKLRTPGPFVLAVLEYRVLPARLARIYGRALPFAEVICGLALVTGLWPVAAGGFAMILFASFLVAVTINLARGRRLDCHCFGSDRGEPIGWTTLLRLGVLLPCAVAAAVGRGAGPLARPLADTLPVLLLGVAIALGLHLVGAAPALWRIWHTPAVRGKKMGLGRVNLSAVPLTPTPPPASLPIQIMNRSRGQEVEA